MSAEDERERNSSDPRARDDAALGHAWHEVSREEPPSNVDARILAAARASVGTGRTADTGSSRWWTRWQPMLAAAAVAGLAFVLVPMTSAPPPAERATESTAPAAAQTPGTASEAIATSQAPPAAGAVADRRRLLKEPAPSAKTSESAGTGSRREAAVAGTESGAARAPAAVPPPPAAAESVLDDAAPAGVSAESTASGASSDSAAFGELGATAPRRSVENASNAGRTRESAAAAPTAQAREKRADQAAVVDADAAAWVERIAAAYRDGDLATATAELRAFRTVEPAADDRLPDDVRNWARTVK